MDATLVLPFTYSPLSTTTSKRLLKLEPNGAHGPIQLTIWEVLETDATPYRCLSYTWGPIDEGFTILINNKPMKIRESLHSFLTMASQRLVTDPDWLGAFWVDALCINQEDDEEKNIQVQRMRYVYQHASEVLIWLGTSEAILSLVEWAKKPRGKRNYLPFNIIPKHLRHALLEFVDHPYWTRSWVIQEIILAQSLILLCGFSRATADVLNICTEDRLLQTVDDMLNSGKTFKGAGIFALSFMYGIIDIESSEEHSPDFKMGQILYLLSMHGQKPEGLSFWDIFMSRGRNSKCFDPRDRIYSLLGLTGLDSTLQVDYGASNLTTFVRLSDFFDIWAQPEKLIAVWDALELTPDILHEDAARRPDVFQRSIRMRKSTMVTRFTSRLKCARCFSEQRMYNVVLVDHESCILLCSDEVVDRGCSGIHVLLRPIDADRTGGFAMSVQQRLPELGPHRKYPHWYPRLDHLELWHDVKGIEEKLTRWEDILRLTDLSAPLHEPWEASPRFLLKVSHEYILQVVERFEPTMTKARAIDFGPLHWTEAR